MILTGVYQSRMPRILIKEEKEIGHELGVGNG